MRNRKHDRETGADADGTGEQVVPVHDLLGKSGMPITRSQARNVLRGLHDSATVILDFTGVENIGRAFADEIFRVFAREHPRVLVIPVHASPEVVGVITAVRSGKQDQQESR